MFSQRRYFIDRDRWREITREYLIVPSLIFYIVGMWEQQGNPCLIFVLYFMFFLVSSLISLCCSLYLRYRAFGCPVQCIGKRILSFLLIIAIDIFLYNVVLRVVLVFFSDFFISKLFSDWRLFWCSTNMIRWISFDYFLLKNILKIQ